MTINEIIDYVRHTPGNVNPNVLKTFLQDIQGESGDGGDGAIERIYGTVATIFDLLSVGDVIDRIRSESTVYMLYVDGSALALTTDYYNVYATNLATMIDGYMHGIEILWDSSGELLAAMVWDEVSDITEGVTITEEIANIPATLLIIPVIDYDGPATAEVTFINSNDSPQSTYYSVDIPNIGEYDIFSGHPQTFTVALINGLFTIPYDGLEYVDQTEQPQLTGLVTMGDNGFIIRGDCTIAIKGTEEGELPT